MGQPDGSYPRLNGELLKTGLHQEKILSLIGTLEASGSSLLLADRAQVNLDTSAWVADEPITSYCDGKAVEVIGQMDSPDSFVVFVVRKFSKDMDLGSYNRMLKIQHDPKFAQYFAPTMTTDS